ncbi:MAG: SHOCT domain-containing protein [Deltaproteobacteria bacterium]|jgi:putative membrane protein|nr:SHOCT domain-containing protein [Deltaproteobacteria bacterium]
MSPGNWEMMPWFGMTMAPLMMLFFLVVAFVIAAALIRWLGMGPPAWHHQQPPPGLPRTALDILNERFARGEIDRNEYEEKKRLLSQ